MEILMKIFFYKNLTYKEKGLINFSSKATINRMKHHQVFLSLIYFDEIHQVIVNNIVITHILRLSIMKKSAHYLM